MADSVGRMNHYSASLPLTQVDRRQCNCRGARTHCAFPNLKSTYFEVDDVVSALSLKSSAANDTAFPSCLARPAPPSTGVVLKVPSYSRAWGVPFDDRKRPSRRRRLRDHESHLRRDRELFSHVEDSRGRSRSVQGLREKQGVDGARAGADTGVCPSDEWSSAVSIPAKGWNDHPNR